MSLFSVYQKAMKARDGFMNSITGPDTMYGKAMDFKNDLNQAKNDLVPQAFRDLGFGEAQQISNMPFENMDSGSGDGALNAMRSVMSNAGISNQSAGMLEMTPLDLSAPRLGTFVDDDTEYLTPVEREMRKLENSKMGAVPGVNGALMNPEDEERARAAGVLNMTAYTP